MFVLEQKTAEIWLEKMVKWTKYDQRAKVWEVDFKKPFWHLYFHYRLATIILFLGQIVNTVLMALVPFVLGYVIEKRDYENLIYLALAVIGIRLFINIVFYLDPWVRVSSRAAVEYSANKFFLMVDPQFHTTKSSGQIISKINRGSKAVQTVLNNLIFLLFPVLLQFLVFSLAILYFNIFYGIITLIFIITLIILNYFLFNFRSSNFSPIVNKLIDKTSMIRVESLTQAVFIRSLFATPEQIQQSRLAYDRAVAAESLKWRMAGHIYNITSVLFYIFFAFIATFLLRDNNVSLGLITTILFSYWSFASQLYGIGKTIDEFSEALEDIDDLWQFIRNFGISSYPVIDKG